MVGDRMLEARIDMLFLPISGDLEYLTGIPRREPSFGNVSYRHGWVAGAYLGRDPDPLAPGVERSGALQCRRPDQSASPYQVAARAGADDVGGADCR